MVFLKILSFPFLLLWSMLKMIFKIFIWFLKPTKAEKKEKARLRKNARARSKTLIKKGKHESAAAEKRKFGIYK